MSDRLELRNFVGGEHTDAAGGHRAELIDPEVAIGNRFPTLAVRGRAS